MNATTTWLKAGDKVIFVKGYGAEPVVDNVDKVTKAGWVKLCMASKDTFKPNKYRGGVWEGRGSYVHSYTEEKWGELHKNYEDSVAAKEEKRKENEAEREEAARRTAAELAEVKAACGGSLLGKVRMLEVLPDGSKLHILTVPVHPNLKERKGETEVLIVRTKRIEGYDWSANGEKKERVEAFLTYCNNSTSSFPSVSGVREDTEEDALWEVVRDEYHSW